MARPRSKDELLTASEESFGLLTEIIDDLSPTQLEMSFAFEDRDHNVRDVLVHLHEWHQLVITWTEAQVHGQSAPFFPDGFTWRTYSELNYRFRDRHAHTSTERALLLVNQSHLDLMTLAARFKDAELFTTKHFSWTGTTSLGAYFVSSTSSHYAWAIKKIRRHQRISSESTIHRGDTDE